MKPEVLNLLLSHVRVKGIHFRPAEVQAQIRAMNGRQGIPIMLCPEPTNAHDKFAIKVFLETVPGDWMHVGYLPKELAQLLAGKNIEGTADVFTLQDGKLGIALDAHLI